MNILITNDDGIEARGLKELVRALHEDAGADIYICAPDGQRSATGHGITMNKPIKVSELQAPGPEMDGVKLAYQISGLPADCVKIAREFFRRKGIRIDMVFSGINHGGNLGTDTLYSGTVSAALEGSLCGFPSVAVSVDSHQAEHFEYICELAVNAAKAVESQLKSGTADPKVVLNINTPNLPKSEIKGLRYTILGPREYDEIFVPEHIDSEEARLQRDAARAAGAREEGAASPEVIDLVRHMDVKIPGTFRYSGTPVQYPHLPEKYDVVANHNGYATITPIHTDLTCYGMLDEIREWGLG